MQDGRTYYRKSEISLSSSRSSFRRSVYLAISRLMFSRNESASWNRLSG